MEIIDLTTYPSSSVNQLLRGNIKMQKLIMHSDFWDDVETGLDSFVKLTKEQKKALKKEFWA